MINSYLQIKILPVTPHHNVSKEHSGPEFISIPAKIAEHVMVQYNICFKQKCKYTQTVNICLQSEQQNLWNHHFYV
jgi:hypothetical protein